MVEGVGSKVIQLCNACHHRSQGGRKSGIVHVGEVHYAIDAEIVEGGVKCGAHHTSGSRKLNDHPVGRDGIDLESLGGKPFSSSRDVLVCGAKLRADLRVGKPLVKAGGLGIMEVRDQPIECGFVFRRSLKDELESIHRSGIVHRAPVIGSGRLRASVAGQNDQS